MTAGFIALSVVLSVGFVFVFGTLVYVVVSYAAMRGHVPPRSAAATLREMVRELALAFRYQPLLPLYYFVGRRFGGPSRGVPVILVHGYFQNRVDFIVIARGLRRAGLGPLYGFNYPWMASVSDNGARLAKFADHVREEAGATAVDLVCHSMGGLIAVEAMKSHALPVRRCVTVASPHAGVLWKGPILGRSGIDLRSGSVLVKSHGEYRAAAKVLSLASTHDNVVYPNTSTQLKARGGEDVIVGEMGHLSILFARSTVDAVVGFLAE